MGRAWCISFDCVVRDRDGTVRQLIAEYVARDITYDGLARMSALELMVAACKATALGSFQWELAGRVDVARYVRMPRAYDG